MIKGASGLSYAEIFGKLRKRIRPTNSEEVVKSLKKLRTGVILVELDKGTENKSDFSVAGSSILGATNEFNSRDSQSETLRSLLPKKCQKQLRLHLAVTKI